MKKTFWEKLVTTQINTRQIDNTEIDRRPGDSNGESIGHSSKDSHEEFSIELGQ